MEAAPGAFDKAEAFTLDFSVQESAKESSAEKPVLFYERNGFTFRVTLDLLDLDKEITIELVTSPDEALASHSQTLAHEVAKLAAAELDERRDIYGNTHFA